MPSRPLVSVEEYVHSSYDPDCDYVDGASVERLLRAGGLSEIVVERVEGGGNSPTGVQPSGALVRS